MSNPKAEMIALAQRCAEQAYGNIKALYPNCVPNLLMPGIFYVLADEALRAERTAAPASGEVASKLVDDVWSMFVLVGSGIVGARDAKLRAIEKVTAALASSLKPQQDVEALVRALKTAPRSGLAYGDGYEQAKRDMLAALARVPPAPQPVACGHSTVTVTSEHLGHCKDCKVPMRRTLADWVVRDLSVPPAPAAQAHIVDNGRITQIVREHDAAQARSAGRVDVEPDWRKHAAALVADVNAYRITRSDRDLETLAATVQTVARELQPPKPDAALARETGDE